MSRFLSDLNIERLPRKRGYWRVAKPLLYLDSHGRMWEVLAGTETDGASIPRLFWRIIGHPLDWEYAESAVLHDYLYGTQLVCRAEADELFREAMKSQGVSGWKRGCMWAAVRMFGQWSWDRSIWMAIMLLSMVLAMTSCRSIVHETRNNKEWVIETRSLAGLEISREEYPEPTVADVQQDKASARGMRLIYIGAICGAVAIAAHVMIAMGGMPVYHRIAEWAMAASAGCTGAGIWVCAMAVWWQWILFLVAAAVVAAGLYALRRWGWCPAGKEGQHDEQRGA